jgi:hypothetical protein
MAIDLNKYKLASTSAPTNLDKYKLAPTSTISETPSESIWSKIVSNPIVNQIKSGVSQIKEGASTIGSGKASPLQGGEAGLAIESGIASIISSPLAPLFSPVSKVINKIADKVSDISSVQKFAESKVGQVTARVAQDLSNAGNVAGTITGIDKVVKEIPTAIGLTEKGIAKIKDHFATTPEDISKKIVDNYTKGVKPGIAGKTGAGQLENYNSNVVNAVESIKENKLNLSFEDENGAVKIGELPKTRAELADAVNQTKKVLFDQYNTLQERAGGQGVQIPLEPAGLALDEVIGSEALKITNPGAIEYAKGIQQRLQNVDGSYKTVTPQVAQDAITNWNSSLKAFYKTPTYETASRAAIDAGVVSKLREVIDEQINNATGDNYQALKNQYGALSAIEKDVNKAALVQAKQTGTNTSGLGKYVDVFSGGDMVSGLLSLNPALFAKGAAQAGISHFFQWLNSPDRAVGNIFKTSSNNVLSK